MLQWIFFPDWGQVERKGSISLDRLLQRNVRAPANAARHSPLALSDKKEGFQYAAFILMDQVVKEGNEWEANQLLLLLHLLFVSFQHNLQQLVGGCL